MAAVQPRSVGSFIRNFLCEFGNAALIFRCPFRERAAKLCPLTVIACLSFEPIITTTAEGFSSSRIFPIFAGQSKWSSRTKPDEPLMRLTIRISALGAKAMSSPSARPLPMKSPTTRTFWHRASFQRKLRQALERNIRRPRSRSGRLGCTFGLCRACALWPGLFILALWLCLLWSEEKIEKRARAFLCRCGRYGSQHHRKGNEHRHQNAVCCAFELAWLHLFHLRAARIVTLFAKERNARRACVPRSSILLLTAAENRKHFRAWMSVWLQAIALLESFDGFARC